MGHTTTDYLYILAIYDESISLDRLLFHTEPGEESSEEARTRAEKTVENLARRGLAYVSLEDGDYRVGLTERGRLLSQNLAEIQANDMVTAWHAKNTEMPAGYPRASGY